VCVGAKPVVVCQIEARVIRIFVDGDVVPVPKPVSDEPEVGVRDGEIEALEPEAAGSTAFQVPDMTSSEAARETAVLKLSIHMEAGVVRSGFVAHPFAIAVNMGRFGMARLIRSSTYDLWRWRGPVGSQVNGSRPMAGRSSDARIAWRRRSALVASSLSEGGRRQDERECEKGQRKCFHVHYVDTIASCVRKLTSTDCRL
jgi:hypothetical protein